MDGTARVSPLGGHCAAVAMTRVWTLLITNGSFLERPA